MNRRIALFSVLALSMVTFSSLSRAKTSRKTTAAEKARIAKNLFKKRVKGCVELAGMSAMIFTSIFGLLKGARHILECNPQVNPKAIDIDSTIPYLKAAAYWTVSIAAGLSTIFLGESGLKDLELVRDY